MEDLLTAEQVAQRLQVQPSTVRGWARKGLIPVVVIGHKVHRFRISAVVGAMEHRAAKKGG